MNLFIVKRNFQAHDDDMYYHWAESETVSFHSTNEKALAKIQTLIEEEFIELSKNKERNKHISDEYWQKQEESIKANERSFSVGTYKWSDEQSYPYYDQEILPLFFINIMEID